MKGRIITSERPQGLGLPIIGKIKVGLKDNRGLPKSTDYFVPSGKYAALFRKAYGEKPQTLQIVFHSDEAEAVCREEYQYRDDAGKLIAYGDGAVFMVWNGKEYARLTTEEYPNLMRGVASKYPNRATKKGGDGWVVTLTVTFMLPAVRGVAGLWQFTTKGAASSIPNIRDAFDTMLEKRGFCRGIIWDMNVTFATTQKPNDTSRFPVVSIVPNESEENVKLIREAYKPLQIQNDK